MVPYTVNSFIFQIVSIFITWPILEGFVISIWCIFKCSDAIVQRPSFELEFQCGNDSRNRSRAGITTALLQQFHIYTRTSFFHTITGFLHLFCLRLHLSIRHSLRGAIMFCVAPIVWRCRCICFTLIDTHQQASFLFLSRKLASSVRFYACYITAQSERQNAIIQNRKRKEKAYKKTY